MPQAVQTNQNQTLDRGLTALELIAFAEAPPSIDDVARMLDVHRSIAYRIIRTLEDRGYVRRGAQGRCVPGERLATFGRHVRLPLQAAALPELSSLAEDLGMTAFIVTRVGDEAVTLESIEPRTTAAHVAYRPGNRHPVDRGAPGLALLAGAPRARGERAEITAARERGWASSSGEVIPGLGAAASWVRGPHDEVEAAVACVYLAGADVDVAATGERVRAAAERISCAIGGRSPRTGRSLA
jgi:DNA-binding IclR family transcriptional regulator